MRDPFPALKRLAIVRSSADKRLIIERRPSNSCRISVLLRDVNKDKRQFCGVKFYNTSELKS